MMTEPLHKAQNLCCAICLKASDQLVGTAKIDGCEIIYSNRHTASWKDLEEPERQAMMQILSAKLELDFRTLSQGIMDGHFYLKCSNEALSDQVQNKLISGVDDHLINHLVREIDAATKLDIAIAFAMLSGVKMVWPYFKDLITRGGKLRIIIGDYLDVTDPDALLMLLDLKTMGSLDQVEIFIFETRGTSFHPKAWHFRNSDGKSSTIVGSSNLSKSALTNGVEWNFHSKAPADSNEVLSAFEDLLNHTQVIPLTYSWVESYTSRRKLQVSTKIAGAPLVREPTAIPPKPHGIQLEALSALKGARELGDKAGMVVLATGLGKTWLSAFDSIDFKRVLFVAHREEILSQALETFRQIRPRASFGRYSGLAKEDGDIIFASIQTISRAKHLKHFEADQFDYIVIDEFHHATANSYSQILNYFAPQFLLGLTATPDRTDGKTLLSLCDGNLIYRCDLFEGIERRLLAPFKYFGVPDDVDYDQIPWRSKNFDEKELTAAVATETRANNALEQLKKYGVGPAIGFCVSMKHADFMADYFVRAGLRAVAVHSGSTSAPRSSSLERLAAGELDILFSVDMFNEGVDVPNIGTILMLRPTESKILFLQQLGRGLRLAEDKVLRVIDYIGNHRIFLTKAAALLGRSGGDRALLQRLDEATSGTLLLPPNCEVTYDLTALEMLKAMLRMRSDHNEGEAWYINYRVQNQTRPTASKFAGAGFTPDKTGHGGWFDFVSDMGDELPNSAYGHTDFFKLVSDIASKDFTQLLVLKALISTENLDKTPASTLQDVKTLPISQGLSLDNVAIFEAWDFWSKRTEFQLRGSALFLRGQNTSEFSGLLAELIDWKFDQSGFRQSEKSSSASISNNGPVLWQEYKRQDIPALFGAEFNTGSWQQGIVKINQGLVLLTTINKKGLTAGEGYHDKFLSDTKIQWQSQNRTTQTSNHADILSGKNLDDNVYLFVRFGKLRGGKAAPFLYVGQPKFLNMQGEKPITFIFNLSDPLPQHLHKVFLT